MRNEIQKINEEKINKIKQTKSFRRKLYYATTFTLNYNKIDKNKIDDSNDYRGIFDYLMFLNRKDINLYKLAEETNISYYILNSLKRNLYKPSKKIIDVLIEYQLNREVTTLTK